MLGHWVKIQLDGGNDQTLHPGQILSGTVEFKAPSGTVVKSVRIDFRGVTKIIPKKNTSHINIEHVELFQMGEVMQSSPMTVVVGKEYKWNFTFAIPKVTGPDRSNGIYNDGGNPHFVEGVHTLPPSIKSSDVPETKIEYNIYCIVSEQSTAVAYTQEIHALGDHTVVDVLDHLKLRPDVEAIPESVPTVLEKSVYATGTTNRRFSLTLNRKSASRNSSLAAPIFVEARVPSVIVPGQEIEILLSIRKPDDGCNSSSSSRYVHKFTSLQIKTTTHRRTAKTPHHPGLDISSSTKLDARKGTRAFPVKPEPPMLLKFSTNAIRSLPPSFKSYSLAREYHLHLTTTLQDDTQELGAEWMIPVRLVHLASDEEVLNRRISLAPPPPAPMPVPRSRSEPWNRRAGVEDDLPPAYEPRE